MATEIVLANADNLDGINLADFIKDVIPNYGRNAHKSFFLRRELAHTQESAKRHGVYRHCKPYKGHFLDYIVRKEFATLEDWLTDCGGSSMYDIMFGFSKFDGRNTYITLEQLINHLKPAPVDPEKEPEMDELTKFLKQLHMDDLELKNLMVRTQTRGLLTYREYMEE